MGAILTMLLIVNLTTKIIEDRKNVKIKIINSFVLSLSDKNKMAIKISGTTVIDDSRNIVNINSGLGIGIQSAGNSVGTGITIINFTGIGNTFTISGGVANVNITSGVSAGNSASLGIVTAVAYSNVKTITTTVSLANTNHNYLMVGACHCRCWWHSYCWGWRFTRNSIGVVPCQLEFLLSEAEQEIIFLLQMD